MSSTTQASVQTLVETPKKKVEFPNSLLEFVVTTLATIPGSAPKIVENKIFHTIAINQTNSVKYVFVKDKRNLIEKNKKYPLLSKITSHFQNIEGLVTILGKCSVNIVDNLLDFKSISAVKQEKNQSHLSFFPDSIKLFFNTDKKQTVIIVALTDFKYKNVFYNNLEQMFPTAFADEYEDSITINDVEEDVVLQYLQIDSTNFTNFISLLCKMENDNTIQQVRKLAEKTNSSKLTKWQEYLQNKQKH